MSVNSSLNVASVIIACLNACHAGDSSAGCRRSRVLRYVSYAHIAESLLSLCWRLDDCTCTLVARRSAPLDTVTELRQLVDDLTELGDTATAALVRKATDKFMAWKFEAGERLLERALEERRKHEHEPPRSPYFNTCTVAVHAMTT